jgi:hypothetical protein
MRLRPPPWLALLLLAPAMGELLSGSSPPAEFFQPFGFTIMTVLYGCGALLCRELKVRWRKGVGSLVLLGCAYAVAEEGLMVASFFNPDWVDLGALHGFGRALDVNWVWAVELTIYHALFSVTAPVLLVELMYPDEKAVPWLSGRGFKVASAVLLLDVFGGLALFGAMLHYYPPAPQYLLFIGVAAFFVRAAHRLPGDWLRRGTRPTRRPLYYAALSLVTALVSVLIFGALPNVSTAAYMPLVVSASGVLLVWSVINHLRGYDWRKARRSHLLGLVSGPVLLLVAATPIQELDASRVDDTSGMMLVGAAFLALLGYLWFKVRARDTRLSGDPVEV